ncbi:hypothetical protein M1403_03335 [Patescibacteria group bacterium]|nr:hypothetical protein [Patescibacteria group bacterium]
MPATPVYGRRVLTPQTIFTYLVLAVVAYALAVYIFAKNSGRLALPGVGLSLSQPVTISLNAQNNSGETGTATLMPVNDGTQTQVTINLQNAPSTPQPAHIHIGVCPNPGAVKYPLSDVVSGQSTTVINATLEDFKNMEPLAINVHQSPNDIQTYVACGDIKF